MPVLETTNTCASNVRKGDLIREADANGLVTKVEPKQKFTYIHVDGEVRPYRIALDSPVTVERSVPTAAEKAARELEAKLQWLDMKERLAIKNLAEARTKIADTVTRGYAVDHWTMESLLEAQSSAALWARVAHVSQVRAWALVDFDPTTERWSVDALADMPNRVEVMDYIKDKIKDELLHLSHSSRSTSVTSNAVDDVDRQAKINFLSRW